MADTTRAWIFLTASLAIHVWDEAANDFLSVYNPFVVSMRETYPGFPAPLFTFSGWLTMLIIALVILFLLTYFVVRQQEWMLYFSILYAWIMVLNGIGHIIISLYTLDLMPGVYSSPILIISAIYMMRCARRVLAATKKG